MLNTSSTLILVFSHDTWYKNVFALVFLVLSCREMLVNVSNVDANPEMVMIHVPDGKRPPIDDIKGDAAGLTELKELMKRCWDEIPEERPQALGEEPPSFTSKTLN